MKSSSKHLARGLLGGAALMFGASPAMAHGRVDWSINIGAPAYYPPPVVYSPPPVVYVQPQSVYVEAVPVVRYGRPYYVEEIEYRRFHHRHHHWRDDRD